MPPACNRRLGEVLALTRSLVHQARGRDARADRMPSSGRFEVVAEVLDVH
jgi:hypothetical protein